MAVQTTVTTAYRSHAVEGLNGFVSMRTSVAFRPGRSECRIGANQVVGPLTGEASGFIGSGVRCIRAFFVHSAKRARHWEERYTRWTIRDRGHGWETTQHPFELSWDLESRGPPTSVAGGAVLWKWRDVLDQLPCLLVHAPDVAAMATVVASARAFAQGRQEPDLVTVVRWTLRDRRHGWEDASIDRL